MRRRRVRWLNMNIYAGPVAVVVMITYGHFHLPLGILLWEAHCTILLKRFLERRAFIPCQFQIETAVRQIFHYSYKRLMACKNMTKYWSLKNIWQSSLITFDLANMSKGTKEISYINNIIFVAQTQFRKIKKSYTQNTTKSLDLSGTSVSTHF